MKKLYELIQKNLSFSHLEHLFRRGQHISPLCLPVITISREKGSGGRLIAEKVAKKLGNPWKVYHQEVLEQLTKESKLEKELLRQVDEKNIPVIEQMVDDFFGKKYVSTNTYYATLIKVLSAISQRGHGVIIGRGANFLLPSSLKVRVICEMEQRIEWLMRYEHLTRRKAITVIDKADTERNAFVKKLYNHDPRKAHHYDLIIRTGKAVSLDDAANLIVCAAKRRYRISHKRPL